MIRLLWRTCGGNKYSKGDFSLIDVDIQLEIIEIEIHLDIKG